MPSLRALVVDDEKNVRLTVTQALEDEGLDVKAVATGQAALEALRQAPCDVVLLDLRLPDQSGLEVLRRIRDVHPGLPVIIFTAYGSVQEAVEATRLGVVDFLEKPLTPDELRAAVQSVRRQVGPSDDTDDYDACITQAKRQVHQQRFSAARNTLHEAIGHAPNRPEAHALLGIVHAAEGRMKEAEKAYRAALRVLPDDARPLPGAAADLDVPAASPKAAPAEASDSHRVLVCVDDLQADRDLARYAAVCAAARAGAELVVLHVFEVPKQLALSEAEDTFRDDLQVARERLDALADTLRTATLTVRSEVIVGHDAASVITNFMEATPVTHVMLGWKGTRSSAEALLGTTIDTVAKHCASELTLLRIRSSDPYEDMPQRIVAIANRSPHAPYAVRRAFEFAQHVGVATLTLLTAQSSDGASPEAAGRDRIRQVAARAGLDEADYEPHVVVATDPQAALIEAAQDFGLICVGTSPDTPIAQALFGSLPETLCAETSGTVAVVRGPHYPTRTLLDILGARLSDS